MTYDTAAQLTKITAGLAGAVPLTSFSYSYTNPQNNQPTTLRYSSVDVNGSTWRYEYDALNRLTGATQTNALGLNLNSFAYAYDFVGNMISRTVNGSKTSMSYNQADQLTAGGAATYTYDANGNETSGSGATSVGYNAADQTTGVTPSGSSAVNMVYTGEGQAERTTAGPATFQYDLGGISSMTTGAGTTFFTRDPDGALISERTPTGTYYYLYDGLGSVVGLTDSTGRLVNSYSYDPYGNVLSVSEAVSNPFRFTGAIWDSSTGLYKMGERYYDPGAGRFMQHDALGGDYIYTDDNPVNFTDPLGLKKSKPQREAAKHRPPGCCKGWKLKIGKKGGWKWVDPHGGQWKWHGKDETHGYPHWDYDGPRGKNWKVSPNGSHWYHGWKSGGRAGKGKNAGMAPIKAESEGHASDCPAWAEYLVIGGCSDPTISSAPGP